MKLEDALIHSYAMLVMRGRCKITDIPESYREGVRDFVAIDIHEEVKDDSPQYVFEDKGPLTIPRLELTLKSGEKIRVKTADVLPTKGLEESPQVIKYELVRVEPQVAFEVPPKMTVITKDDGFELAVTGKPAVKIVGIPEAIGVVKVISRNYEEMNLTLYVTFDQ